MIEDSEEQDGEDDERKDYVEDQADLDASKDKDLLEQSEFVIEYF